MNTKTEVFAESTETPRQRLWRRTETIACALAAAVILTLTVLGFLDPMIVP
jgi:NhaP-type Na+/H+ or K+/H+ antiporter